MTIDRLKIYPKAVVCCDDEAELIGEITISSGCVIHPNAIIHAKSGPIIIGENCLIEEYATIIHDTGTVDLDKPKTLVIGPSNVFEVGCTVEASAIGERNVFECKSYVSNLVTVSNNCIIGAGCKLIDEHILPENTVIYGKQSEQRETIEKQKALPMQLDHLRKVLPNYHHIKKPTFDPRKSRDLA